MQVFSKGSYTQICTGNITYIDGIDGTQIWVLLQQYNKLLNGCKSFIVKSLKTYKTKAMLTKRILKEVKALLLTRSAS